MKIYTKKFFGITLIVLFVLCFGLSFIAFFSAKNVARADTAYGRFLPNKSEEYYALSSPIHAYSDDEITAVTEEEKLILFTENGITVKDGLTSLKQINRVGNRLFYADNGPLYTLPVANPSADTTELKDNNLITVSGTFFDTNGTYLATMFSSNIQVYRLNDTPIKINTISGVQEKPVALNSTSMFYVAGNMICRQDFDSPTAIPTIYNSELLPDYSMIANDEFVYFISGTKIMRLKVNEPTAEQQELVFSACTYDLGIVHEPQRLAFKNGNLLITDKDGLKGSVQEFRINGNELEFTGYAIASGLTAYNRVATSATNIERYGNFVAALDGKKLTVIDTENCADYNKKSFINKRVDNAPDKFALGNGTVLYSDGVNAYIADVANDTEDNQKPVTGLPAGAPNDISYQSGVYYLIYLGTNSKIVKIDEKTGEKTDETEFNGVAANLVAADVFGNIYVAYNDKIYKNNGATVFNLTSNVQKLATDLAGNLFVLASDGKIYKLDETTNTFTVAVEITAKTIKTFGMDFDRKEIYFLLNGDEQIYSTIAAGNVALADVTPLIAEQYNAATANKKELDVYTAKDGANVYSVSAENGTFAFDGLIEKAAEYPLIAKITANGLTMCALASENGVVLINEKDCTPKATEPAEAPEKAFLTTSVGAYSIPVIEKNGLFIMDKGAGKIKLDKGATVTVNGAFTLLNKKFYHATATVNGENLACYIPADFTATVLAENFEFEIYTVEKTKKTVLYKNSDLTEELFELSEGETVKLLETQDGVLKVAATREDGTFIGYIKENSLVENPSVIVRNVLIILAVFGSLAGTVSYFLLRKKR
ncbi:MAG: hypothetical protein VZQ61_02600 [Christensenellaceae bacterium]